AVWRLGRHARPDVPIRLRGHQRFQRFAAKPPAAVAAQRVELRGLGSARALQRVHQHPDLRGGQEPLRPRSTIHQPAVHLPGRLRSEIRRSARPDVLRRRHVRAQMSTRAPTTAAASPGNGGVERMSRTSQPFDGGRFGFGIVVVVALILTINSTAPHLVTAPVAEWFLLFLDVFAINVFVGIAILFAAIWARHRYPTPGRSQYVGAFVAVTIAAALSILAVWLWNSGGTLGSERPDWTLGAFLVGFGTGLLQTTVLGLVITAAWLYTCTETEHAAAVAQCAVDSARMDEQTAEARLQMLEAQIEPHFLFNTLAHVKRLY